MSSCGIHTCQFLLWQGVGHQAGISGVKGGIVRRREGIEDLDEIYARSGVTSGVWGC